MYVQIYLCFGKGRLHKIVLYYTDTLKLGVHYKYQFNSTWSIQSITFIKRIIRGLESSGGLKTWRQFELFSFVSLDCEGKKSTYQ